MKATALRFVLVAAVLTGCSVRKSPSSAEATGEDGTSAYFAQNQNGGAAEDRIPTIISGEGEQKMLRALSSTIKTFPSRTPVFLLDGASFFRSSNYTLAFQFQTVTGPEPLPPFMSIVEKWEGPSGTAPAPYPFACRMGHVNKPEQRGLLTCSLFAGTMPHVVSLHSSNRLDDGAPHRVVLTVHGRHAFLYVDGILNHEEDLSFDAPHNSARVRLGSRYANVYPFHGIIQNVRLLDKAVSQAELGTIFTATPQPNSSLAPYRGGNIFFPSLQEIRDKATVRMDGVKKQIVAGACKVSAAGEPSVLLVTNEQALVWSPPYYALQFEVFEITPRGIAKGDHLSPMRFQELNNLRTLAYGQHDVDKDAPPGGFTWLRYTGVNIIRDPYLLLQTPNPNYYYNNRQWHNSWFAWDNVGSMQTLHGRYWSSVNDAWKQFTRESHPSSTFYTIQRSVYSPDSYTPDSEVSTCRISEVSRITAETETTRQTWDVTIKCSKPLSYSSQHSETFWRGSNPAPLVRNIDFNIEGELNIRCPRIKPGRHYLFNYAQ